MANQNDAITDTMQIDKAHFGSHVNETIKLVPAVANPAYPRPPRGSHFSIFGYGIFFSPLRTPTQPWLDLNRCSKPWELTSTIYSPPHPRIIDRCEKDPPMSLRDAQNRTPLASAICPEKASKFCSFREELCLALQKRRFEDLAIELE